MHDRLVSRQRTGALVGLAIVFSIGLWSVVFRSGELRAVSRIWVSDGIKWGITFLVLGIALYWERKPLSSLGLRSPAWQDLGIIPLIVIAIILVQQFIADPLVHALGKPPDLSALGLLRELPVSQKFFVIFTAGITEEILYRGYAIERIESLTGSTLLAVLLTTGLFVGVHIPVWGTGSAIYQTLTTLVLAGAYVWRRNLAGPIGAHMVTDSLGILMPVG